MPLIGVISDIHANLPALETAINLLKHERVEQIVVCGDVVGYGKSPNECCEIVRGLNCPVVAGNHDWAVAGRTEYQYSHSHAAIEGIEYTKKIITQKNLAWLRKLPLLHQENDMFFVHASPVHPEEWRYLKLGASAQNTIWDEIWMSFDCFQERTCFVGHSHYPALFLEMRPGQIKVITPNKPFYELADYRAIVDVGSVGFPRNSAKKSSLVISESETRTLWFKRFRESIKKPGQ